MRKLFLFIISIFCLAVWSCSDDPEPEDCLGVEGGSAYIDSCGTCDDISANDCVLDCSGEWGGVNVCGCTDMTATNYDPDATFDDGSCTPDEIPPSVVIISPTAGSEVSEITSISFTVNDNVGIEKVEVHTANGLIGTLSTGESGSINWNTDLVDNGDINIYALAYDLSGNVTTSDLVLVTVANTITITFNNQCFLPVACGLDNSAQPEFIIDPQSSYSVERLKNSEDILFQGVVTTTNQNSYNYVCSEAIAWEFDVEVGSQDVSPNLVASGSVYFIRLRNSSVYTINDFYANYDLSSQRGCSIDMPNDEVQYPIGYFVSSSNANARVYVDGESGYWLWDDFGLNNSDNQYVNLNFSASGLNIGGQGGDTLLENSIHHTHILEKADFSLFDD